MAKAIDIFEDVTARIIRELEEGITTGTWTPPWRDGFGLPVNAATGVAYKSGNVIALWIAAEKHAYTSQTWATYKQWAELGAQVRKGEKGTSLVKWVVPSGKRDAAVERKAPRLVPIGFSAFNAAQVDDYVAPETPEAPEPLAHCEQFFASIDAPTLRHADGEGAYYSPSTDRITLPPLEHFHGAEGYYATLAHEHVHATGHKDRLNRDGIDVEKRRDPSVVAYEELVAEIGSAFLATHLGIHTPELDDQHRAYLRSWVTTLKVDPKALYRAASAAQRAFDLLVPSAELAAVA